MNKFDQILKDYDELLMNKLEGLWGYAVFRWCVYQATLLFYCLLFCVGMDMGFSPIWIFILACPAVWVWRKPILKMVKPMSKLAKQVLGYLNNKAEQD